MPKSNAAPRVHLYVASAMSCLPQKSVIEVMLEIFSVKVEKEAEKPRIASRYIELFLLQVDTVERALTAREVPPDLWERALTRVRNTFNPQMLGGQWQGVIGNLTPDVPLAFQWAGYVLPSDQGEVAGDENIGAEVQSLLSDINELEQTAQNIDLPESLRRFLGENLTAMKDALRMHGITGIGPLKEAVRRAAGDLALRSKEISEACQDVQPESQGFVKKAFGVIRKGAEVARETADTIDSIDKLIGYAAPIVKTVLSLAGGTGN